MDGLAITTISTIVYAWYGTDGKHRYEVQPLLHYCETSLFVWRYMTILLAAMLPIIQLHCLPYRLTGV